MSSQDQNYDPVTSVIGNFGRWQMIYLGLTSLVGLPGAWHMLSITFFAPSVDHWCARPPSYQNLTVEQWKTFAIPKEKDEDGKETFSQCAMFNVSGGGNDTIGCETWEYDTSKFHNTIVNQWNLVCDDSWLTSAAQSTYMLGVLTGAVICGMISDRFGRRLTLIGSSFFLLLFGVATTFVETIVSFIILRIIVAISTITLFTVGFVYCMELVGGKWRAIFGSALEFPFAFGFVSIAGLAYAVNDWHNLQLVISVPLIFFIVGFWFVPESPRWLATQGRLQEAEEVMKKICEANGRSFPAQTNISSLQQGKNGEKHANVLDLFRSPNMRKKTLNIYYNWFVNSFVYYGLSLNSGDLGGDLFINILLGGAVEFPAYGLCILVLVKAGRRWPLCITMVIGGIGCLLTMAFTKGEYPGDWPIVTCAMIGKFGITASFAIIYVFSAELYPTSIRNTGVGTSSMFARIGGAIAPYVALLGKKTYKHVPVILFGTTSILAGVLALLLPETKGRKMPDTLEEAENFDCISLNDRKTT